MATKRMFSNNVIDSDVFLDLPPTAQLLYFLIGMKTDDDGFVAGVRRIMKLMGGTETDIATLVDSGLLIPFPESKVFVVTHFRINNDLKGDRYHPTVYQNEYRKLMLTENKEYRLKQDSDTDCIQSVSKLDTDCIHNDSDTDTESINVNVFDSNVLFNQIKSDLIPYGYSADEIERAYRSVSDWTGIENPSGYVRTSIDNERKRPTRKTHPAQNYKQRDYSNVDDEIMQDLAREMEEFKKGAGS